MREETAAQLAQLREDIHQHIFDALVSLVAETNLKFLDDVTSLADAVAHLHAETASQIGTVTEKLQAQLTDQVAALKTQDAELQANFAVRVDALQARRQPGE